jgi:PiT family inorganic phosphate transporter
MVRDLRRKANATTLSRKERKRLKKLYKQDLVKRALLLKVIAAWVITVPASATLAAIVYFALRGFMLG